MDRQARINLSILMLLAVGLACRVSPPPGGRQTGTPLPPIETVVVSPTSTVTPAVLVPVSKDRCVTAMEGLWLRTSPNADSEANKLYSLPTGTRVQVLFGSAWSRVYVKSIDLYGYVNSDYLGECK